MREPSLGTQLFVLQMVIVLLAVGGTGGVWAEHTRDQLDALHQQRALAIAQSVAALPQVREAFDLERPDSVLQPLAMSVQQETGADYVVIANTRQERYAHPNASLIGKRLSTDGSTVLRTGRSWVGTETGTIGTTVRGKTPIRDEYGQIIGLVSVGVLETTVISQVFDALPPLVWTAGAVLLAGLALAAFITARVRRQTFGLEPREIAALLEQREGVLHGVKEGVLALDLRGRITLVNDAARELLGEIGEDLTRTPLSERMRDVLGGADPGEDRIVLHGERVLVLNRTPVSVRGRHLGWVVTLRDRTELVRLARELDDTSSATEALRAQAHEFANRMHTVVGLLELGEHEAAIGFITRTTYGANTTDLRERVQEPTLAALLLAKSAEAAERGAELVLAEDSSVPEGVLGDPRDAVLVVGNLVANAIDALDGARGTIEVSLRADAEGLRVRVGDSGPGIAPDLVEEVFREGFTTKAAQSGPRGLGLALTRQACLRRGGWVRVRTAGATAGGPAGGAGGEASGEGPSGGGASGGVASGGAVFTALLPAKGTP
ncbi:ATP-binding protein [Nonomuraea candida]|uniref:ATP-binding protein n=1 Tax=Nonomuraea candida TaxID=359159 RepID=UPI000B2A8C9E|nr:sensor histidine kinase [Nonomuraea candida]